MLVSQTWIKLIDFGMAKRLIVDDVGFSLSTSTIVGTVRQYFGFGSPKILNWLTRFFVHRFLSWLLK